MIRVTCPSCGSKLNAKDELVGQTRKCPKCAQPVRIVADAVAAPENTALNGTLPDQRPQPASEDALPPPDRVERLSRSSHYLIVDRVHVVAAWENNGNSWMLKTNGGFVIAKRNREIVPPQGDYKLVELKFTATDEGKRLTGLMTYQLSRWAMATLIQGDDQIVEKITGHGSLNKEQKNAIRQALREQFMRPIWEGAVGVIEYLGNTDYHSPGVG